MLVHFLLIALLGHASMVCGEDGKEGNAKNAIDFQEKLNALSNQLNGLQSKVEASQSAMQNTLQAQTDKMDKMEAAAIGNRLSKVEKQSKGLDTKVSGIDKAVKQQEAASTASTKSQTSISQRIDAVEKNLKSVETLSTQSKQATDKMDFSQFVPKKDFNDLQTKYEALKTMVDQFGTLQGKRLSETTKQIDKQVEAELNKIRKELKDVEKSHESSQSTHSQTSTETEQTVTALQKEVKALKASLADTKKQLSSSAKQSSKGKDGVSDKLTQLNKAMTKQNAQVLKIVDEVGEVRQGLTDLEVKVTVVKSQTIGAMMDTVVAFTKKALKEGSELCQEKATVAKAWVEKNGKPLMEKGREQGLKLFNNAKEQSLILKEKVVSYDYSWMTDKENWRLLGKFFQNMAVVTAKYTREQLIPAIRTQSTQAMTAIRSFFVDFYQNRRNYVLYQEISKVLLPLLKQVPSEYMPKQYHELTVDVVIGFLAIIGVLFARGICLMFCNCVCPKVAKIDDEVDTSTRRRKRKRNKDGRDNKDPTSNNAAMTNAADTGIAGAGGPGGAGGGNTSFKKKHKKKHR